MLNEICGLSSLTTKYVELEKLCGAGFCCIANKFSASRADKLPDVDIKAGPVDRAENLLVAGAKSSGQDFK